MHMPKLFYSTFLFKCHAASAHSGLQRDVLDDPQVNYPQALRKATQWGQREVGRDDRPRIVCLNGRGAARAEDAQGTPTQSHTSPSILVYEDKDTNVRFLSSHRQSFGSPLCGLGGWSEPEVE